ncbi:hypothetical protein SAMN05192529_102194 [Arachidicoccus rhizosphaerae]|jgi:hypothetical protein|uniref:Uncharacterized protein n=1 Tax=Arachidicoccus rhizosphaerae TaxID=551991 RepID=A0A1H3W775_9BACT|nr:DUF5606 domain-containing protein [Arachidicoccus rhizosphaerae]SDZ82989.1 hypothetical protein SAMN05192529_102194 [Arachidicoccus rhizosphaerae]
MEYNKIISVTGLGGLFELIGSKADGAIVRSLEDKTTKFASSRSHHFSHLESIEVYTIRENVNLIEVFRAMQAAGKPIPDYKDIAAVKAYFTDVYPDMDFERVYTSDMKKMVRWYNILVDNSVSLESSANQEVDDELEAQQAPAEQPAVEKKAKAPKKAAAKKQTAAADAKPTEEAKPKKKAAPKKKADKE